MNEAHSVAAEEEMLKRLKEEASKVYCQAFSRMPANA